jgi:hypothetical protein
MFNGHVTAGFFAKNIQQDILNFNETILKESLVESSSELTASPLV